MATEPVPARGSTRPPIRAIVGVSAALLPLVYLVVGAVLFGDYSEQLKTIVVTAVLTGPLGAIVGYWLSGSDKQLT